MVGLIKSYFLISSKLTRLCLHLEEKVYLRHFQCDEAAREESVTLCRDARQMSGGAGNVCPLLGRSLQEFCSQAEWRELTDCEDDLGKWTLYLHLIIGMFQSEYISRYLRKRRPPTVQTYVSGSLRQQELLV